MIDRGECQNLIENGDLETAHALCMAAIEIDDAHEAWHMLARISQRIDYTSEAIDFLRKALSLDPNNGLYVLELATLLLRSQPNHELHDLLKNKSQEREHPQFEQIMDLLVDSGGKEAQPWFFELLDMLRDAGISKGSLASYLPIAFLVHHEELINHYRPVWQALGRQPVMVVLAGEKEESDRISRRLDGMGVPYRDMASVLNSGGKIPVLVSNHPLDPSGSDPLIKRLAQRNIRFMYAAGKGGWNYSSWNELYDLILAMGPMQHRELSRFCNPLILPMGWPRMDSYFNAPGERATLLARYHCDPRRKTIVWLPTWTEVSSVAFYADALSSLTENYNVVTKLHPMHQEKSPDEVHQLAQAGFNALLTGSEDNVPLLQIADWVVADYGGSPFAAMYAGKPVLLLDVPNAADHFTMGTDSPDLLLRKSLLHITPDEKNDIAGLLKNDSLWKEQVIVANELLQQHIYPFRGCAASLAASYLAKLHTIIH